MNKVCCAECKKPIKDVVVEAMGLKWHPEHFICAHCKKPITEQRFHVHNELPYCQADYASLFLKKCAKCGEPISDVVVMALGKPWHRDHFTCVACGTVLTQKGFCDYENEPYCQQCYELKVCPKCEKCRKPLLETAVVAFGKKYHPDCFTCSFCGKSVIHTTFKVKKNKIVCPNCDI